MRQLRGVASPGVLILTIVCLTIATGTRPVDVVRVYAVELTASHAAGSSDANTPAAPGSIHLPVDVPLPSWWNNTVCDTAHNSGSIPLGSQSSPAQFHNVYACGPRP